MSKVTRIAQSKNLNQGKVERLIEIAEILGKVRADLWRRYGSVAGVGMTYIDVAKERTGQSKELGLTYKLWRNTVKDVVEDIGMYRAAAKVKVRYAIRVRTKDGDQLQNLYALLKYDKWLEHNFLRRQMRKHYKHGVTQVDNQIVLEPAMYSSFERNGVIWLKVQSLVRGERIAIPTDCNRIFTGVIRLIIRDGNVEIHYVMDETEACSMRPCGGKELGIDKGYTEVYTDSEGDRHGEGLGKTLRAESDYLKRKYQARNKLKAIGEAKPHKRDKIVNNNLGRSKLNHRRRKRNENVRDIVYQATHSVIDKASSIAVEDLTSPIPSKNYGKNQNRRLNSWTKGVMAEALESVSRRRGSSLHIVNAAYTSQTDSRYGILDGSRNGNLFYCFDGEVLDADTNAAQNILNRMHDIEIHRFMPYQDVRAILSERTEQYKQRLGPLIQDSSCKIT